jgi:GntR family transcriptional regulator
MLEYNSAVPFYEQVARLIRHDIETGKFSDTNRLPSEEALSQSYAVSRITIRRAVNELVETGLVEKKQGKGTFICRPKLHKDFKYPATSFSDMCKSNGMHASSKVLEAAIVTPKKVTVCHRLGLVEGEKAVRIMRLRLADEKPLVIEDVYFPMQYAYLLSIDLEHDSLYRYLREEKKVEVVAGDLTLRIAHPDAWEAKILGVSRNESLLRMSGTTYCSTGEILHSCDQIGYGEDFDFIIR